MRGKKKAGWVLAVVVALVVIGQYDGSSDEPPDTISTVDATTDGLSDEPTDDDVVPDEPESTEEPTAEEPTAEPTPTEQSKPEKPRRKAGTALAALATLEVKGRAPMTGYDRDRFGSAWLDADRNGCDTRNDILDRDLTDKVFKPGTGNCVVLSGVAADPYTGTDIYFERGGANEIDIDHVVAMGNAWVTGAFRWNIRKRAAFANDPLGLLAVDYRSNRQKGDADAATWLPRNSSFRCAYVARQVAVKKKYGLWVTPPEKAAINRTLTTCPDQPLPKDQWKAPLRVDHDLQDPGAPQPKPKPKPKPQPKPKSDPQPLASQPDVYYKNCTAVRAAGAAPIHVGEPGYARHLDRDGDGVGCE